MKRGAIVCLLACVFLAPPIPKHPPGRLMQLCHSVHAFPVERAQQPLDARSIPCPRYHVALATRCLEFRAEPIQKRLHPGVRGDRLRAALLFLICS